jgi:Ni2+-binding GTPase involved in maturation of urease and hydrogenase
MKSIRKMGIGSTLCHENESYIVEAVDEMLHKKSDKFRMIILHAICYFPVA